MFVSIEMVATISLCVSPHCCFFVMKKLLTLEVPPYMLLSFVFLHHTLSTEIIKYVLEWHLFQKQTSLFLICNFKKMDKRCLPTSTHIVYSIIVEFS